MGTEREHARQIDQLECRIVDPDGSNMLFDRDARVVAGPLIQTAQRNESLANYYMAKVFAASGDKDRAMPFLFRAVEEGFDNTEMLADPAFEILADDARFAQLMASLGAEQ